MDQRARIIIIIGGGSAALLLLLMRDTVPDEDVEDEPAYESPGVLDQAGAIFQEVTDMVSTAPVQQNNLAAFLWMIRVSEGTDGPNGYSTMVGGGLFGSFADHPRILVDLPKLGIKSSAAGAYQILRRTWDGVRAKLDLPDFSPASQDAAAAELIRQRGALADVNAGRFAVAVDKCKKEWASLPGAGYGQRENSLARLQTAYTQAGGLFA